MLPFAWNSFLNYVAYRDGTPGVVASSGYSYDDTTPGDPTTAWSYRWQASATQLGAPTPIYVRDKQVRSYSGGERTVSKVTTAYIPMEIGDLEVDDVLNITDQFGQTVSHRVATVDAQAVYMGVFSYYRATLGSTDVDNPGADNSDVLD